jgi:hypothetical protein
MEYFIYFVLAVMLLIIVGMVFAISNFDSEVKKLYAQSGKIRQVYHPSQIADLPLPVQNYFGHVLKDGQPYISFARLKHHGRFKTVREGLWNANTGEEHFTVAKPGFVWRGKIKGMTAIDKYMGGKGSLSVYLLNLIPVAGGRGIKFSQGELLRWLGEAVWFPTALLPNENLTWEAIDDSHAKLTYRHEKLLIYYIVTFNAAHEIAQLETRRYMGGKELETWIGKVSNYKPHNNMLIPRTMQAIWKLADGDFIYAVFYLTDIEYDQPKLYA